MPKDPDRFCQVHLNRALVWNGTGWECPECALKRAFSNIVFAD